MLSACLCGSTPGASAGRILEFSFCDDGGCCGSLCTCRPASCVSVCIFVLVKQAYPSTRLQRLIQCSTGLRSPVRSDLENPDGRKRQGNPRSVKVTLFFPLTSRGLFSTGIHTSCHFISPRYTVFPVRFQSICRRCVTTSRVTSSPIQPVPVVRHSSSIPLHLI